MQKVGVEVENWKKSLIFFLLTCCITFRKSKKYLLSITRYVEFHKLYNCIFKNALSLFFTEISWFKVSSDF